MNHIYLALPEDFPLRDLAEWAASRECYLRWVDPRALPLLRDGDRMAIMRPARDDEYESE